MIIPLHESKTSLHSVGGKGHALAELASAGYPVPDGFVVTTDAYRQFVANESLRTLIQRCNQGVMPQDGQGEGAEEEIVAAFIASEIPADIADAIADGYASLGQTPAVAVRSSATAEDLPEMSFAGQQDSFLNIQGVQQVLIAIKRCWASLWTARAIEYRRHMKVDHSAVAMAVVVQRMVEADVSGVLFTANPSSGARDEIVINASYGLGEAIVGGLVTPDTIVVDGNTLQCKHQVVGDKPSMTVPSGSLGTKSQPVPIADRSKLALPAAKISELATLARKVAGQFGIPQDIEWALTGEKIWLLQSRPITNLPPQPLPDQWDPPAEGVKLIRRQVVENMPEPLSPLFEELYLNDGLETSIDLLLDEFGLFKGIEDWINRPMFTTVNGYAYCRADYKLSWKMLRSVPKLVWWYCTSLRSLLQTCVPRWKDDALPRYQALIQRFGTMDPATASDRQLIEGVRELTTADAVYWLNASMVLGAAKITDGMLNRFLRSFLVPGNLTSGIFLRGFPSPTMDAQKELERIADQIRQSESLRGLCRETSASELLNALHRHPDGGPVGNAMDTYLRHYGHLVYNLDFVEPTQYEDPRPVFMSLKTLVESRDQHPSDRQSDLSSCRVQRETETAASLGLVRRYIFRKLLSWAQRYGPHREQAVFYIGAAWPTLRAMAMELGSRLSTIGTLHRCDDVFFLNTTEIDQALQAKADSQSCPQLADTALQQRQLREARKRLHPPSMVPAKSKFTLGPIDMSVFETQVRNADDSDTLRGFPVSPGKVTGTACVIHQPSDFDKMLPDTILVCPTTTPAWTPLFSHAVGLVTDIGGILAHGSIVAREYGIPAVMGTGNGTRRIVSGTQITVDGDVGTVTILERTVDS